MISVVVCSINPKLFTDLKENIEKTIGVPYQLIYINNFEKNIGICENYNNAIAKIIYETICFVHEDIKFHTLNWGDKLMKLLSKPQIGLVGVSGSVYKSAIPSSWTACRDIHYRLNTIQHYLNSIIPLHHEINPEKIKYSKVATVDGVFLATRKDILNEISFDENILTGFHGYDLDISLQVAQKHEVVVTHQILLEHFSPGNFNKEWAYDSIQLHKKWRNILPLDISKGKVHDYRSDYIAATSFLNHSLKFKLETKLVLQYYLLLITWFFPLNGFKFTRSFIHYILSNNAKY